MRDDRRRLCDIPITRTAHIPVPFVKQIGVHDDKHEIDATEKYEYQCRFLHSKYEDITDI